MKIKLARLKIDQSHFFECFERGGKEEIYCKFTNLYGHKTVRTSERYFVIENTRELCTRTASSLELMQYIYLVLY